MPDHNDVLLVGSVPAASAEAVFRLLAKELGTRAKRYPDGETGERINWIRWQKHAFDANPGLALSDAEVKIPGYKDTLKRPFYRIRARDQIKFGLLRFAEAATDSYAVFKRLKDQGVVPRATRFQVSIPTVVALLGGFVVKEDRAAVEPALEAAMARELTQIGAAVPADELSIQWDVCMEVLGLDGGFDLHFGNVVDETVARLKRLNAPAPAGAEIGIHLCYGDPGHKHIQEPKDLATSVKFANAICAGSGRPIAWVHMPVPRGRTDAGYFAPLKDLRVPKETEVYLGLVHFTDGLPGTTQRIKVAETFLPGFGLATECGLGRRDPTTIAPLLGVHRQASETV
jgi:hypothetical protein